MGLHLVLGPDAIGSPPAMPRQFTKQIASTLTEDDQQTLQREVQRLLGRCLIRIQQYERLIKAIVAHHDISGPAHALEAIRAARIDDASTKTLGALVGQLVGSYVTTEAASDNEKEAELPDNAVSFRFRTQLSLSVEDYIRTQDELRELVSLRNMLVHHFIDRHDLWTTEGCRSAQEALDSVYARIDQHYEQLRGWAEHMEQARQLAAEFVQSDSFRDFVINGIAPDGSVDWAGAGIVRVLREAARELSVEGWTPVHNAGRWIQERYPTQQPAKYGCASWRQVLHESRLFELRYREVDGLRAAWYRAKEA